MGQPYRDEAAVLTERLERLREERFGLDLRRREVEHAVVSIEKQLGWWTKRRSGAWGCLVVAIAGSGVGLFYFLALSSCCFPKKEPVARWGAQAVRGAAELDEEFARGGPCPTVDALAGSKKLDPKMRDDPWGRPYRVLCDADGIHVVSDGKDGRPYSGDEVADSFEDEHLERLADR